MVALELFDSEPHGLHRGWCHCFQKSVGYSLFNGEAAYVQTVHAAAFDQIFSGAVIARR